MAKNDASQEEKSLKRQKIRKRDARLQAELCKLQDWVKYKGLGSSLSSKAGTPQARAEQFVL